MTDLCTAALSYARQGLAVFPCEVRGKAPHPQLPTGGFKHATTDADKIRSWWAMWPSANIGIACGASGLVVIDVDTKHGTPGLDTWRTYLPDLGANNTPTVATPTGGFHYFYKAPNAALEQGNNKLGKGVDVKGAGGYVLAPPSIHPDTGTRYEWAPGYGLDSASVLPLPPVFVKKLERKPRTKKASTPATSSDFDNAKDALQHLSPERCEEYQMWVEVGMALSPLGAPGFDLWDDWSQGSTKYDTDECVSKWRTFDPSKGRGLGSLFRWATDDSGGLWHVKRAETEEVSHPNGLTDTTNAERLVERFGHRLRYVYEWGWLAWTGKRWERDTTGVVVRCAKRTARSYYTDAAEATDKDVAKAYADHAHKSQSARAIKAMVDMAQSELPVLAEIDDFDADPWILNCLNGVVDLRTGQLSQHEPTNMITKLAPVVYNPNATSPILTRYLEDTTKDNADFARYLQRACGYSLTGDTSEECFFLVLGPAATGKSTLVEAMLAVLGDYGVKSSFSAFLQLNSRGGATPELAHLRGARLVAAVETAKGAHLNEPLVKEMTGGDTLTVRELYKPPFSFKPTFKLWLAANDAPTMTDTDTGLWRRLQRVPFEHEIAHRDPNVKARLCTDAGPAVLAWAVQGCLAWQAEGLSPCEIVQAKTSALRAEFDPLAEFFSEQCIIGGEYEVDAQELRSAYEEWAQSWGAKAINDKDWGKRLQSLGAERERITRHGLKVTIWQGIGLVLDEVDTPRTHRTYQTPVLDKIVLA